MVCTAPERACTPCVAHCALAEFDHVWSFPGWGANFSFCDGHVCHGAELPFVFDSGESAHAGYACDMPCSSQLDALAAAYGMHETPGERTLANTMVRYWGQFANAGDPNADGLPRWPPHTETSDVSMHFVAGASSAENNIRSSFCKFWDDLGYSD